MTLANMKGESPENYWNCLQREYQGRPAFEPNPNGVAIRARKPSGSGDRESPHDNEKLRQILTNMKTLPLWD